MPPLLRRRLLVIAAFFVVTLLGGTLGYILVEGYAPFDAFYMALTTLTTIGYGELFGMHRPGRIFTAIYILFGVLGLLLSVAALSQTILELELSGYFERRRSRRMIDRLENHVIVCGFGRVGRGASGELQHDGIAFVVIDRDEHRVDMAMRRGYLAVLGDCTHDETLREMRIDRARGLIASLATDADNLFLVITAKQLNPKLRICTRVTEDASEQKLRRAGADEVYAPYQITGARLAQSIIRPHVQQFLDVTTANQALKVTIEQVLVGEESEFVNRTLREIRLNDALGIVVLAVRRPDGTMTFNPNGNTVIEACDHLIVMGPDEKLRQLDRLMSGSAG